MKRLFQIMSVLFSILLAGCGGGGGSGSSTSSLPRFTSESTVSVPENRLFVLILHADGQDSITYTISGGEDSTKFSLDAQTGILTFKSAPDFEDPADSNGDNKYELNVTATDTYDNQSEQTLIVIVTNVIENPDSDNDYIPDNIEEKIGMNSSNPDQNGNDIVDGRDTEGEKGDPFFDRQWHIESLGTVTNESGVESIKGYDLGLLELYHAYMGYNDGENIIVQVVDTGVDADHEDLKENIDLSRSYKGKNVGDDPSPTTTLINNTYDYRHGTMVAGIIAASAFNGKGVRGIAPFAKIAGSNWLENQTELILEKVWLTGAGANAIALSNNSWGSEFDTDTLYEEIMAQGSSQLRDGKGRIYLFPAGNSRNIGGNANLQYLLSNRYAIAVAGLKHDNTYTEYSSPGSNILVSGYSGNNTDDSPTIGTTTVMGTSINNGDIDTQTTWSEDSNENYTFAMNGTSAAAATVSGAVALVLEACPDLTWRDVKYLIAKHAKQIDSANNSWVQNAAGHSHSIDYGFGLINAQGMINDCTTTYTNLPQERSLSVTQSFNTTIADNNTMQPFSIYIPGDITVEWVEVTIDNDSSYASDYRVELISPSDTRTTLIQEDSIASAIIGYRNWMNGGFRLSSAAFLDESSNDGLWRVEMTDMLSGDSGTLKNIQIKIYGH
ncbi:MAG: S8 family serine peptidase [Sulfurovum sp.]|nr:S8 family serine peptidase [Sulfurovum sp.]MDD3499302.1 S8 family serine peptidase [Sulfurovum sp.]